MLLSCNPYGSIPNITSMSEIEYPYDVNFIQLESGINIAFMDEGPSNSEVIIFVHGLGSYGPAWKNNIQELKDNYRCIVIDLPGYGKSEKGNYPYSMKFYAKTLIEFMNELKIQKAHLAGHSMGGQISITTALYNSERVNKLILVSPAGFETFTEGQKDWFRNVLTPRTVMLTPNSVIQSNLAYNFYNFPKDADFMIRDRIAMKKAADFEAYSYAVVKSVQGMVNDPVFDYLSELKTNTLIIFGENDNLIPNRYLNPGKTSKIAESGHKLIPNSELELVNKAGHFVQFEQAKIVNEKIKNFITNNE